MLALGYPSCAWTADARPLCAPPPPLQSAATLLWSLASLRIAQQPRLLQAVQPLLAALSGRLAARMEAALDVAGSLASSDDSGGIDDVLASAEAAQPTQHDGGWGDGGNGDGGNGDGGRGASAAAVAGEAAAAARELPTSTLCTAVWACGQLQHGNARLLRAATTLLHGRVPDMSPADTARTLWGLGQLGYCPAALLGAVAAHLQRPGVLAAFEPRQLAMTTYAFAALDFFPGGRAQRARGSPCRRAVAARCRQPRAVRCRRLATAHPHCSCAPAPAPSPCLPPLWRRPGLRGPAGRRSAGGGAPL